MGTQINCELIQKSVNTEANEYRNINDLSSLSFYKLIKANIYFQYHI